MGRLLQKRCIPAVDPEPALYQRQTCLITTQHMDGQAPLSRLRWNRRLCFCTREHFKTSPGLSCNSESARALCKDASDTQRPLGSSEPYCYMISLVIHRLTYHILLHCIGLDFNTLHDGTSSYEALHSVSYHTVLHHAMFHFIGSYRPVPRLRKQDELRGSQGSRASPACSF